MMTVSKKSVIDSDDEINQPYWDMANYGSKIKKQRSGAIDRKKQTRAGDNALEQIFVDGASTSGTGAADASVSGDGSLARKSNKDFDNEKRKKIPSKDDACKKHQRRGAPILHDDSDDNAADTPISDDGNSRYAENNDKIERNDRSDNDGSGGDTEDGDAKEKREKKEVRDHGRRGGKREEKEKREDRDYGGRGGKHEEKEKREDRDHGGRGAYREERDVRDHGGRSAKRERREIDDARRIRERIGRTDEDDAVNERDRKATRPGYKRERSRSRSPSDDRADDDDNNNDDDDDDDNADDDDTSNRRRGGKDSIKKPRKSYRKYDTDEVLNNENIINASKFCDLWMTKMKLPDKRLDNPETIARRQLFQAEEINVNLGITMNTIASRSAYSLLARLNGQKVLREFAIDAESTSSRKYEDTLDIVREVKSSLWRLAVFAKEHNLSINLSEQSYRDLNDEFADLSRPESDIIAPDAENREYKILKVFYGIMGALDRYALLFLVCASAQRATAYCDFLRGTTHFAILNYVHDDQHKEYLSERIDRKKIDEKTGRVTLDAYFLISLAMSDDKRLRYPSFIERGNVFRSVIEHFVRNVMFDSHEFPANMKIFTSISMKRDCADFNILDPLPNEELNQLTTSTAKSPNNTPAHTDRSGVLALIHLAYMDYNKEKNYVNVKSYVTSTYSSLSAVSTLGV